MRLVVLIGISIVGALLLAGVSGAVSVTGRLALTVTGSAPGIVCDVGPNFLGTVPAGAIAAFGPNPRCLYNLDMAQISNLNTVIDCKGASSPMLWAVSQDKFGNPHINCNDFSIVNDGGTQVLDIKFTAADYNSGNGGVDSKLSTTNDNPYNLGYNFPSSHYTQHAFRLTSATQNAYSSGAGFVLLSDIWEFSTNAASNTAFIELDHNETAFSGGGCCSAGMGAAFWNQFSSGFVGGPQVTPLVQSVPGYDYTQYGTYGARVVSDGSTQIQYCSYLSGAGTSHTGNLGCQTLDSSFGAYNASAAGNYTQRHLVIAEVGPQNALPPAPIADQDMYVAQIVVFGCSNPAGTCNEPIPPP